MQYFDFHGEKLSALGFGAMRLPVIGGDDNRIDEPAALDMVQYAHDHGVNYFDTAWGYHGGNSERVMGRALARFPRDSFFLADKFPGYDTSNFGKHEAIFEEQLARCGVGHFDFYLLHNVCELNIEQYLDDERYGTVSYFAEQARAGRAVLLSSHLLSELELVADFVVMLDQGRVVRMGAMGELASRSGPVQVLVRTSDDGAVMGRLLQDGYQVDSAGGMLRVTNVTPEDLADFVIRSGLRLYHLELKRSSLEELFMAQQGQGVGNGR